MNRKFASVILQFQVQKGPFHVSIVMVLRLPFVQIRLCESTPYPQERNVLRPSNTLVSNVLQL